MILLKILMLILLIYLILPILTPLINDLMKSWETKIGNLISPKHRLTLTLQRQELKAFQAFERVYQTISSVGSSNYDLENQHEVCKNYINNFNRLYPTKKDLTKKLESTLYYKTKSLK